MSCFEVLLVLTGVIVVVALIGGLICESLMKRSEVTFRDEMKAAEGVLDWPSALARLDTNGGTLLIMWVIPKGPCRLWYVEEDLLRLAPEPLRRYEEEQAEIAAAATQPSDPDSDSWIEQSPALRQFADELYMRYFAEDVRDAWLTSKPPQHEMQRLDRDRRVAMLTDWGDRFDVYRGYWEHMYPESG